ncbi:hypothetical protein Q8A67_013907 [Cirrhinus molitorella]|uniref:Protocadherin-9 n=1 Tax=Cirrhinus molitorella TaxID=172907 RepID=A0AA88TJL4_9TELE|nr:hypothetical protein Q8A67_013907 [Cirrhinus molitorella]
MRSAPQKNNGSERHLQFLKQLWGDLQQPPRATWPALILLAQRVTIEVNLQKALAEASETCTQECLILGHSDSCWMPPALTQFQTSGAATLPSFGFQQSWARGTKPDGRHTLGRSVPKDDLDKGSNRPQFYNTLERHCGKKEDPVKVIPLASFSATSSPQMSAGGGSSAFLHEHQL